MSMNKRRPLLSTLRARITVMFLLITICLGSIIATYWILILEPRLRASSEANASAVAQAQSLNLASALSAIDEKEGWDEVKKIMQGILLLVDSNTEQSFVLGLALQLDPDVIPPPLGQEYLQMGENVCESCFVTEIPLYSTATKELIGIAKFLGSDIFFHELKQEIRTQFFTGTLIILLLIILQWWALAVLIKPLVVLAKSLRNRNVMDLTALPGLPSSASEEILLVKLATDELLNEISGYIHNLAESQQYTESIINSMQDALIVLDNNDFISKVNDYGAEMFGYTIAELIGKPVSILGLETIYQSSANKSCWMAIGNDFTTINSEARCRRKNGELIPVLFSSTKRRVAKGHSSGLIYTIKDITIFKQAERIKEINELLEQRVEERTAELKLAQQNALNKERLATVGQLTATVGHELRNPLGTIRNSMYTVQQKVSPDDVRIQKAIGRINRNITRCDNIIEELLDFTRVKELVLRTIMIDTWLADLIQEFESPQEIIINMQLNLKGYQVQLDVDRMRRVIINIYDNACQSMESITKSSENSDEMHLTISTRMQDDFVVIAFQDTGEGLSPDQLSKVFEPLYSTKSFGVGLGLPAVKQIIEKHGGRIEFSSEKGRGVLVQLWLPYNAD